MVSTRFGKCGDVAFAHDFTCSLRQKKLSQPTLNLTLCSSSSLSLPLFLLLLSLFLYCCSSLFPAFFNYPELCYRVQLLLRLRYFPEAFILQGTILLRHHQQQQLFLFLVFPPNPLVNLTSKHEFALYQV